MICVNEGYLIFNTIDRKTWREIKETLQWPPTENQLVVYTQLSPALPNKQVFFFSLFKQALAKRGHVAFGEALRCH